MKKILSFLVTIGFTFTLCAAQETSILWEVSGKGLTKTSYLYGSLKFIGEKEYYLPKEAVEKIKASDIFVIEDQVDHHAQHELNKAVHFPKNQTLATHLTPADYAKVLTLFQSEFNVNKSQFESKYAKLKPLALSISMTRLALGEDVKFYDIEMLRLAKQNKVKAYSLEGVDREAKALNAFSIEDQAKALMHSVDNFATQKEEFKKLMEDYPQGNLHEIFEFTLHPFENNAHFVEEFYYKRNEEWLPKIEKMLSENAAFISIGVTHLEGERGILELLKAKGYTLTPIKVTQ